MNVTRSPQIFVGRSILGDHAADIFRTSIPALARSLSFASQNQKHLHEFVDIIEDQEHLRSEIEKAGEHPTPLENSRSDSV